MPSPHDSGSSTQVDPQPVPPPTLASWLRNLLKETSTLGGEVFYEASTRDKGRYDVDTIPPNAVCLQLRKHEVLQQSSVMARSSIKLGFGDLTSGNVRTVTKIIAGDSFSEMMGC